MEGRAKLRDNLREIDLIARINRMASNRDRPRIGHWTNCHYARSKESLFVYYDPKTNSTPLCRRLPSIAFG